MGDSGTGRRWIKARLTWLSGAGGCGKSVADFEDGGLDLYSPSYLERTERTPSAIWAD